MGRPRRYPRWQILSCAVDLLTHIEEQLRERGDEPNAINARQARFCVLAIALGAVGTGEETVG
jgi:hypothetical protein